MKHLVFFLFYLFCLTSSSSGFGQIKQNIEIALIAKLDKLADSLELYPKATYSETHNLFSKALAAGDSSAASIVMSQLSGFYNSMQHTSRMLEAADSSALVLPRKPSFEAKFRVTLSRNRAAARRRHTEEARRWVDTLDLLMVNVDNVRKKHAFLLSDAITSVREKRLAEALDLVREADALVDAVSNPRRQEATHTIAAIVYTALGNTEESDKQILLARDLMNPITRPISRADRLEFLAYNRANSGEPKKALVLLDSAESMLQGYDAPYNLIRFKSTRAQIIGELGDWAKANTIFNEVLRLEQDVDSNPSHTLYWIGISHRGMDNYDTAIKYFKRAVDESLERKSFGDASFFAGVISESYEWKNKFEPALKWFQTHIEYRDSVTTADFALKQEMASMKYEAFRTHEKSKEIISQAQLVTRKNQLLASILTGTLLIGFLGIYAFRQRQKANSLKELEAKRKQAEMQLKNLSLNQQLNLQALTLAQKNALLKSLESDLSDMRTGNNGTNAKTISKLSRTIRNDRTEQKDWEVFIASSKVIHSDLFKALRQQHPGLTSNDHRLLAMVRLSMTTKEMSSALSVSDSGVKKARYRVRKKLNLDPSESLSGYLIKLEESAMT